MRNRWKAAVGPKRQPRLKELLSHGSRHALNTSSDRISPEMFFLRPRLDVDTPLGSAFIIEDPPRPVAFRFPLGASIC